MKRLIKGVLRYPKKIFVRIRGELRLYRCRIVAWMSGTRLNLGTGVRLSVPLRINGGGEVSVGDNNSFGYRKAPMLGDGTILIQARGAKARIVIGNGSSTSNNISIVATESITIGDRCQIGDSVAIYDTDFHEINPATRNQSAGLHAPVCIGNNVWLGSRVMVLKGVTIADNSVVGAMSLVTKSIPADSIAAGVPAKVLRTIE
jgi:maltose O-acetyltransferase